jgi:hypothetical protein
MYAVEVRNVHGALIRRRVVLSVLIHVQSEEHYVHAIEILKNKDTLASIGKLVWIVLVSVAFFHPFSHF